MEIQKLFVTLAFKADEYKQGLDKAAAQTKAFSGKIGSSMKEVESKMVGGFRGAIHVSDQLTNAMFNVGKALLPVGVALGAVAAGAKMLWSELNRGAELELARSRFDNLTQSIGTTADSMLGKMREATRGMISDAQLIASGSDIISLGLANTEDQAVRLASVVGQLGWDMQQVILTFANNSTMRLDALGLSVAGVTARAKELEAAGMSMDEAFDLAVIEAGEEKLELLGSSADTTAGQIKQLETAWNNARDAFSQEFAAGVADEFERVAGSAQSIAPAMEAAAAGAGVVASNIVGILGGLLTNPTFIKLLNLGIEQQNQQAQAYRAALPQRELAEMADIHARKINKLAQEYADLAVEMEDAYRITEDSIPKHEQLGITAQELTNRYAAWVEATNDRNRAAEEARAGILAESEAAEESFVSVSKAAVAASKMAEGLAAIVEHSKGLSAFRDAFRDVLGTGDYTTQLPGADRPLVSPERTFTVITGGITAEQSELVEEYQNRIGRLNEQIRDLTNGIGTYGIEQEKVNEKVADAQGEVEHYQALLAPLTSIVGETSTSHQGMAVNVKAAEQAIFDQLVAIGAAPELITAYGVAIGVMSQSQADAALAAALLQIKIGELATEMHEAMKEGGKSVQEIMSDARQELLDYAAELTTVGEELPAALAEGVTANQQVAIDAIAEASQEVIRAANSIFEIHSPSQVFLEMGDNLGTGLVQGFSDNIDAARSTLEDIGRRVIDGVNAGIEAAKSTLRDMLAGVSGLIPDWLKQFLGISSPAAALVPIGVAITEGIIEGIRLRADEALATDEIVDIIDEMLNTARLTSGLADSFGSVFADRTITPIQSQIDTLLGQVDIYSESIERMVETLGLDPNSSGLYHDLFWMTRFGTSDQQRTAAIAMQFYEDRADLANELATAQDELIAQEEKLLRLEQQRADLDFLRQQYELIKLVRDNNLDASILEGIAFGVDADAELLMNAMIEATQQMIQAVEDELGIHSPSRWAMGLMHNVFDTMAMTAEYEGDALERSMRQALTVALSGDGGAALSGGRQSVDNSRRSTNYGGIHIYGEARRRSPLELLEEMK